MLMERIHWIDRQTQNIDKATVTPKSYIFKLGPKGMLKILVVRVFKENPITKLLSNHRGIMCSSISWIGYSKPSIIWPQSVFHFCLSLLHMPAKRPRKSLFLQTHSPTTLLCIPLCSSLRVCPHSDTRHSLVSPVFSNLFSN